MSPQDHRPVWPDEEVRSHESRRYISAWETYANHSHNRRSQFVNFSKEYGLATIRALFLLNGGAAIAVLTLIGALYGKGDHVAFQVAQILTSKMKWAVLCFGAGLLSSVLASAIAYFNFMFLAHQTLTEEEVRDLALGRAVDNSVRSDNYEPMINITLWAAVGVCLAAFVFFARGGAFAFKAFALVSAMQLASH